MNIDNSNFRFRQKGSNFDVCYSSMALNPEFDWYFILSIPKRCTIHLSKLIFWTRANRPKIKQNKRALSLNIQCQERTGLAILNKTLKLDWWGVLRGCNTIFFANEILCLGFDVSPHHKIIWKISFEINQLKNQVDYI